MDRELGGERARDRLDLGAPGRGPRVRRERLRPRQDRRVLEEASVRAGVVRRKNGDGNARGANGRDVRFVLRSGARHVDGGALVAANAIGVARRKSAGEDSVGEGEGGHGDGH